MQWLADLIIKGFRWVLDLVVALLELFGVLIVDAVCYVIDGFGSVITWILEQVDLSSVLNYTATMWTGVPLELLDVAVSMGLRECLAIIGAAILIRLGLQLIPFTRLGS